MVKSRRSSQIFATISRHHRKSCRFDLIMDDRSPTSSPLKPAFYSFEEESQLGLSDSPIKLPSQPQVSLSLSGDVPEKPEHSSPETASSPASSGQSTSPRDDESHGRSKGASDHPAAPSEGDIGNTTKQGVLATAWDRLKQAWRVASSKFKSAVGTLTKPMNLFHRNEKKSRNKFIEASRQLHRQRREITRKRLTLAQVGKLKSRVEVLEKRVKALESAPRAVPTAAQQTATARSSALPPPPPSAARASVPPPPPPSGAATPSIRQAAAMTPSFNNSEQPTMGSIAAAAAAIAARRLAAMGSPAAPSYIPPSPPKLTARAPQAVPPPPPSATSVRAPSQPSQLPPATPRALGSIVTVDVLRSVRLRPASETPAASTTPRTPAPALSGMNLRSHLATPTPGIGTSAQGSGYRAPTLQEILSVKLRPSTGGLSQTQTPAKPVSHENEEPSANQLMSPAVILRQRLNICPSTRKKIEQRTRLTAVEDDFEEEDEPKLGVRRKSPVREQDENASPATQRVCRTPLRPVGVLSPFSPAKPTKSTEATPLKSPLVPKSTSSKASPGNVKSPSSRTPGRVLFTGAENHTCAAASGSSLGEDIQAKLIASVVFE